MFEKLWNNFHLELLNFIRNKVSDQAVAEDILQDVFIKVHQRIDSLQDIKQLNAWLYRICKNAIIDHYRTNKTLQLNEQQIDAVVAPTETHSEHRQLNRCIQNLIEELPEQYNQILLSSELEQEKQQTIAERQELSLAAVKSRIKRGRLLLKQKLHACCDFEFNDGLPDAICKNQCGCST